MIKNLLTNWKTTSAGAILIAGSLVHIAFLYKAHAVDEGSVMTALTGILGGIGLLAAGDASQSVTPAQVDTTFVKKPDQDSIVTQNQNK